jgi:hypothetical protein
MSRVVASVARASLPFCQRVTISFLRASPVFLLARNTLLPTTTRYTLQASALFCGRTATRDLDLAVSKDSLSVGENGRDSGAGSKWYISTCFLLDTGR